MDEAGQSGDAGRADDAESHDRAPRTRDRSLGFPSVPDYPETGYPSPFTDRGTTAERSVMNGWAHPDGPWSNAGTALEPTSGVPAWRRPPPVAEPARRPEPAPAEPRRPEPTPTTPVPSADNGAQWPDARSRYADLLAHLAPEPRARPDTLSDTVSASAPPYPYEGDLEWAGESARHAIDEPTPPGGTPAPPPGYPWPDRAPYGQPPADPASGYVPAAPYGGRSSVSGSVPQPAEPVREDPVADEPAAEAPPEVLPQRVPAKPDVPIVPEPPPVEPSAETPELARIATHLRRDDVVAPQERPDGFDVNAILAAVREVDGVRDAALRATPEGAHSLRLDLADGADAAEVSRRVARLLQERMGLAAAMRDEPRTPLRGSGPFGLGPPREGPSGAYVPSQATPSGRVPMSGRPPVSGVGRAPVSGAGRAPVSGGPAFPPVTPTPPPGPPTTTPPTTTPPPMPPPTPPVGPTRGLTPGAARGASTVERGFAGSSDEDTDPRMRGTGLPALDRSRPAADPADADKADLDGANATSAGAAVPDVDGSDAGRSGTARADAERSDGDPLDPDRPYTDPLDVTRSDVTRSDVTRSDVTRSDATRSDADLPEATRSDLNGLDGNRLDADRSGTEPLDANPPDADPADADRMAAGPLGVSPLDADLLAGDRLTGDPLTGDPLRADPLRADPFDQEPFGPKAFDEGVVDADAFQTAADPRPAPDDTVPDGETTRVPRSTSARAAIADSIAAGAPAREARETARESAREARQAREAAREARTAPVEARTAPVPTEAPRAPSTEAIAGPSGESRQRVLPGSRQRPDGVTGGGSRRYETASPFEGHLEPVVPEVPRPIYPADRPGPRVVIENVQVSTFGIEATVEVRLVVGDEVASGTATGPAVDGYLLRLCAMATASAVDELLTFADHADGPVRCFVEHAAAVPFGTTEVAVVVLLLSCGGWVEQLAGSAVVTSDHRHAMVRATLAAVNRRLEALLS